MDILGFHEHKLEWYQMCVRAVITFFCAIIMVRIAGRRTFGKHTPFDVVVGIIMGGMLAKAIVGDAPFWESILASFVLVILHRLLAMAIYSSKRIEKMVKGSSHLLVEDGFILKKSMKQNLITEEDLLLALHKDGNVDSIREVEKVYEEVSGEISIIKKKDRTPKLPDHSADMGADSFSI